VAQEQVEDPYDLRSRWDLSVAPFWFRMRTRRERRSRRALATLGAARLVNFLRAVQHSAGCHAVTLFLEHLDGGQSVKQVLFDGAAVGYSLDVEVVEPSLFRIEFGCQPDPMLGDGGMWEVGFDGEGAVISVVPGAQWKA
jgi:hypothetical protein